MNPSTPRITFRLVGSALLLAAGALAHPAAFAAHGLSATTAVCYLGGNFPPNCDRDSTTSEFGEAGAQVLGGAQHAAAIQGYGVFHGSAAVAFTSNAILGSGGGGVRADAAGSMQDAWTITGGTGLAYLQVSWAISGSSYASVGPAHTDASAYLETEIFSNAALPTGTGGMTGYLTTGQVFGSGLVQMTGSLPFYFGRPIYLSFLSGVHASAGFDSAYTLPSYTGAAGADFAHTAVLTSVQAIDAQGSLITDIAISAESGALYPLAAPVPEPATWLTMGLGLAALIGRASRRHRFAPGKAGFAPAA